MKKLNDTLPEKRFPVESLVMTFAPIVLVCGLWEGCTMMQTVDEKDAICVETNDGNFSIRDIRNPKQTVELHRIFTGNARTVAISKHHPEVLFVEEDRGFMIDLDNMKCEVTVPWSNMGRSAGPRPTQAIYTLKPGAYQPLDFDN